MLRWRLFSVALGLAALVHAGSAEARSFRVADIPNGDKRECLNCHGDTDGSTRTNFGSDAQTALTGAGPVQERHVDWLVICARDSDGDGWTNGYELGDPDCVWTAGASPARSTAWNPGDPKSHPPPVCNNGRLDAGEACEGDQMAKSQCMEMDAGSGELGCNADCTYDYSDCSRPPGGFDPEGGESSEGEGCSAAAAAEPSSLAAAALAAALLAGRRRRQRSRPI